MGRTISLIVGRIFKFERRISLGPPATGHRVNQTEEESSALVRVTKNRIRALKKGKSTLSLFLSLSSSSPATSLCICMRKSIAAKDWFAGTTISRILLVSAADQLTIVSLTIESFYSSKFDQRYFGELELDEFSLETNDIQV